ncbi:MAG: hypothetical protein ACRDV3_11815 [Acidothermaceae bacterium]
MSGADDVMKAVRKVLGDKPLYLIAGASDLVNEKLRELPDALNAMQSEYRDLPIRAAGAVVGQAFRANLKLGQLYDEISRRGEDVVAKMHGDEVFAEEDEPFVREPFMPEPVHEVGAVPVVPPKVTKTVANNPRPKKSVAKKPLAGGAGAKKVATKKTATTAKKAPAPKKTTTAKKSATTRRPPAES